LDLNELQKNWNEFGRTDPLWAILSSPDKINGKWDRAEFFRTGVEEIDRVMQYVDALGVSVAKDRAMDFGCGVGRLTQGLCRYFDECCGVDIAPSMIALARKYNQYGARCQYHLNESNALRDFEDESWDFVYSTLVLQHMRPEYSKNYIKEFLRVLRPGGVVFFQIPAEVNSAPTGITALPDSAFRAGIRPHMTSLTAQQASQISIIATVKNLSLITWPSAKELPNCPIGLGNHWLTKQGEVLVLDDSRARLDRDLKPNEEIELNLSVTTPAEPGDYVLELDMVQELVAWFVNKGSEAGKVPATITEKRPTSSAPLEDSGMQPKIEMYGVPKQEVLEIVASAGGRPIDVRQDFSAGLEWTSHAYCVTKLK
jgi:ubiquinone/menaquinone biosynthesis C-methylase UbiE